MWSCIDRVRYEHCLFRGHKAHVVPFGPGRWHWFIDKVGIERRRVKVAQGFMPTQFLAQTAALTAASTLGVDERV